jgi:hypothetical protein
MVTGTRGAATGRATPAPGGGLTEPFHARVPGDHLQPGILLVGDLHPGSFGLSLLVFHRTASSLAAGLVTRRHIVWMI